MWAAIKVNVNKKLHTSYWKCGMDNTMKNLLFLTENTAAQAPTVRAFCINKKKKLYNKRGHNYEQSSQREPQAWGRLENQRAKQENLYKEEKQLVYLHTF